MRPTFKHLKKGDKVSAREYNRRGDLIAAMASSLYIQSHSDSTGFHTRRLPSGVKKVRIFEVQSSDTGFGMYTCREEIIDKTNVPDETGLVKTIEFNASEYLVMNLLESDPPAAATYHPALAKYDLMMGWEQRDDEGYVRYVGIPLMNDVRWVRVKEVTPATQHITCNLWKRDDTEAAVGELGYEIEVYGLLAAGINFDDVTPQLEDDGYYQAHCVQGRWWFIQPFDLKKSDAVGENGLRIAKIKSLDTDHYNCRLLAKDKTTELGAADINVYPEEHLGTNNLSGTDIWPTRAVNDFLSVYYDIDGVWRTPGTVDDTTTCEGKQITISASADDTDVSGGVTSILVNTAGGNVVLGGLDGGSIGQHISIIKITAANSLTLEHEEATGTEKFVMHTAIDETLGVGDFGGYTFVFSGVKWFDNAHARHV